MLVCSLNIGRRERKLTFKWNLISSFLYNRSIRDRKKLQHSFTFNIRPYSCFEMPLRMYSVHIYCNATARFKQPISSKLLWSIPCCAFVSTNGCRYIICKTFILGGTGNSGKKTNSLITNNNFVMGQFCIGMIRLRSPTCSAKCIKV